MGEKVKFFGSIGSLRYAKNVISLQGGLLKPPVSCRVNIHYFCVNILFIHSSRFRKTGSVSREIREIQNQIKQEESRDFSSKIEKLATDMKILQKENSDLAKLLKKH